MASRAGSDPPGRAHRRARRRPRRRRSSTASIELRRRTSRAQAGSGPWLHHPVRVADRDPSSVDDARDARARPARRRRSGKAERQPARDRPVDDRAGEDVGRHLVDGGRQPEDLVGIGVGARSRPRRGAAVPAVSVPVLSNRRTLARASVFEGAAALDDDPALGRPRDPGHDRDRRREEQRARRRDDEHRQGPDRVAGDEPGDSGDGEGQRQEQDGVAVGQADERRLRVPGPRGRVGRSRRRCWHRPSRSP